MSDIKAWKREYNFHILSNVILKHWISSIVEH